jgi:ATP-binding cassette, subfamily B, bacterial PglK
MKILTNKLKKLVKKLIPQKLWEILTIQDKKYILIIVIFSFFVSLIETIGVTAIMPFIAVASDFDIIHSQNYYSMVYDIFSFKSEAQFIIVFGVILICFYLFRSVLNFLYYYVLSRFSQTRYHLIACRLFENYLNLPYQEFIGRNSSTMTKTIVTESLNLNGIIFNTLYILSEIFVVASIYTVMLYIDYKITLVLTLVLALNALLMIKTVSVRIKNAGVAREKAMRFFYEIINRTFGNYKLIKLYSNYKSVQGDFEKTSYLTAKANIKNLTLIQVPRLFLEAIAFSIIISLIIYFVWINNSDISELIGLLSMFVLALYRLMPSATRILNGYNSIVFNQKALDIIHSDLNHENENLGSQNISFNKEIILQNINFNYEKNKKVLNDVNISIKKGSSVAFVGQSGSGKSTIVDIIMGLYKLDNGSVFSDKTLINHSNLIAWRRKIGYIPQSVYLFDGTAGQNVAFGLEYNSQKIDEVLRKANIYEFLITKDGQETKVGEGGITLSGGQRQRIAIARALYTDPEILIMDEATSALDDKIEKQVMNEIYELSENKTLIIIAHRVSTLYGCEKIYRVEDGKVFEEKNVR